jgi:hypothetical protein
VLGGQRPVLRAGDERVRARDVERRGALAGTAVELGAALVDQGPEPGDLGRRGIELLLGLGGLGLGLLEAVLGAVVPLRQRVELSAVGVDLALQLLRLRPLVVDGIGVGATGRDQRDERDDERERGDPGGVPGAARADGRGWRGLCG